MMPKINTALLVIVLSSLIWVFAERKVIKSTDSFMVPSIVPDFDP